MVGDEAEALQVVEDRIELFIEKRQPVLHAGIPPAFGDGDIQGVVAGGSAEGRQVIGTEAADRIRRQRHFAHRIEIERAHLPGRPLACRVEAADALQRIAEEIEAHGLFRPGHEDIENTAAHREFTDLAHGRDPVETVALQAAGDIVHAQLAAGLCREGQAFDHVLRGDLLQQGIDGDEDDRRMWLLVVGDQPAKRRQPACRRVGTRGNAVIGKAVPGRQGQHRNFRRNERQHLLDVSHALSVGKHVGNRFAGPRQFRDDKGIEAGRNVADRQRHGRRCKFPDVDTCNHSATLRRSAVICSKSGA